MLSQGRQERYYRLVNQESDPFDLRDPFSRDRDRILFSSAFRRLSGITQVIQPNGRYATHNRLTHSLEVAQIARSIATHLLSEYSAQQLNQWGGLNLDVVEAAALAHDIGHPPFGHVSEEVLQAALGDGDSFEGNAQSFRAIAFLSSRFDGINGLNLTRATLSAVCKYPWTRDLDPHSKTLRRNKWSAYQTEREIFDWSREHLPSYLRDKKTLEAEIMDWSDDIAYAVHDLEDFYRAGMIPLERLGLVGDFPSEEIEKYVTRFYESKQGQKFIEQFSFDQVLERATELLDSLGSSAYQGKREDRVVIRRITSGLVSKYIGNTKMHTDVTLGLENGALQIDPHILLEVAILKGLTVHYVINSPALAVQRIGQKAVMTNIVRNLITELQLPDDSDRSQPSSDPESTPLDVATYKSTYDLAIFTPFFQEIIDELRTHQPQNQRRAVADFICSLTENQALSLGRLISGSDLIDSLSGVIS